MEICGFVYNDASMPLWWWENGSFAITYSASQNFTLSITQKLTHYMLIQN